MDYSELLIGVLQCVKEAGKAILEVYHRDFEVVLKDDCSPLTKADKRSHEIIERSLIDSRMRVGNETLPILSEEGRDISYEERSRWHFFWLVDPLDGTKEFVKKNGEFTVNVALVENNKPVLGVIYAPTKDIAYFAAKGFGAYEVEGSVIDHIRINARIGREAHNSGVTAGVSAERTMMQHVLSRSRDLAFSESKIDKGKDEITVIGSRSHATSEVEDYINKIKEKYDTVNVISAGSALKFCLVAEGKADIYPRFGPTMEWDTAAGQIIVEESGGTVVEVESGVPMHYNKVNLKNPWFLVARDLRIACP